MSAELAAGVRCLAGLTPTGRAACLAELAHALTVVTRVHAASGTPPAALAEELRQLNEIQHQVTGYVPYALSGHEDLRWLECVVSAALGLGDVHPRVAQAARSAWQQVLAPRVRGAGA